MHLPNKLTIFRIILVPFFVVFMKVPVGGEKIHRYIALMIFIMASLTDYLDGYIARRDNLVTDFGQLMDPLADKLLICTAMICLIDTDQLPSWIVIVIISREFIISGFRLIAANNRIVIAASQQGTLKTISQMAMIFFLLVNLKGNIGYVLEQILIYLTLALTVISLIGYLYKNKQVMSS